jgi:hypothetical protein
MSGVDLRATIPELVITVKQLYGVMHGLKCTSDDSNDKMCARLKATGSNFTLCWFLGGDRWQALSAHAEDKNPWS